jgi:hypothetical protein
MRLPGFGFSSQPATAVTVYRLSSHRNQESASCSREHTVVLSPLRMLWLLMMVMIVVAADTVTYAKVDYAYEYRCCSRDVGLGLVTVL